MAEVGEAQLGASLRRYLHTSVHSEKQLCHKKKKQNFDSVLSSQEIYVKWNQGLLKNDRFSFNQLG